MVELIWDGKYDANGRRVAPPRLRLPFQTVETVNESAELRQRSLFGRNPSAEWRNRLIWGDKKYVLPALLDEFAGKVDLIYIDPPFATGADFSFRVEVADQNFTKEPSVIEQKAYRDTWGRGIESYLQWFYETVLILRELLTNSGSLFVHLDDNIGPYAKVVLDEVFGSECYQSEVIWQRTDPHNDAYQKFGNIHDTIYWYGRDKKPRYYPEAVRTELSQAGLKEYSLLELADGTIVTYKGNESRPGRRFKLDDATWKGSNPLKKFTWRGATPSRNREWMYTIEGMEAALERGELYLRDPNRGAARCKKSFLDQNQGILLQDIWTDVGRMKGGSSYPTEKPEPLLERIISATTTSDDLALDCFCGSGTTAAVAERLGRRWIAADLGRFAVHTTRKRLLAMPDVRPFVVQNLGKYERQAWQAAEFGGPEQAAEVTRHYRRFILDLYGAREVPGYVWLHGLKAGRMVHVGAVDSPVSPGDVTQIALEFRKAAGRGADSPERAAVDVLGWDFAFELNEVARQQAQAANIAMRFIRIPREVLEQKAVDQGDIRFFELAALAVDVRVETFRRNVSTGRDVALALTDFAVPPDDVPDDVQRAISHWSQWIDYWAVDWDNKDDTFHNMWQAYRTRQARKGGGQPLQLQTTHRYEQPGDYTIMVKVIDILGNDTTKTVKVTIP